MAVRNTRALLVLLLAAASAYAQTPDLLTGAGRISGRILSSTSEPIEDATVLLGLNESGDVLESGHWSIATSDRNGVLSSAAFHPGASR